MNLEGRDPMGRHYQEMTLRAVQSNGGTAVYLVAMKSTLGYESADVLQSYLRNVVRRYNIADRLLSICTDRGAPNLKAVRNDPPVEDFFG
jgi:arginine repressor